MKSDKANFCVKCYSSHKGSCSSSTFTCRLYDKPGYNQVDYRIPEHICHNCRQMGHKSSQYPNLKIYDDAGSKKTEAPKGKVVQLR